MAAEIKEGKFEFGTSIYSREIWKRCTFKSK